MIKVGITGGIGSGKSVVCRIFNLLGVPVYDCDKEAKKLINCDPQIVKSIKNLAGDDVYTPEGNLINSKLAQIVFSDKNKLNQLNAIVHPAVKQDYQKWCQKHKNQPYTIMESAILFESKFENLVDIIVTVTAPEQLRITRTIKRDNSTKDMVTQRIHNQMNDCQRIKKSNFVIDSSEKSFVITQVLELNQKFNAASLSSK